LIRVSAFLPGHKDSIVSTTISETSFHYIDQKERFEISLISNWRRFKESWRIFAHNRLALLGLGLLLIYVVMAVAHPILMHTVWPKGIYDPVVGHDMKISPNPSPPSRTHLLGTDVLGRDVLSTLMAATAPSLEMALTAALTAAIVGTLIGAVSAYFRGLVDGFFSHLADLSLLAPAPIVMVIIGFMLDIDPWKFGLLYGLLVGVGGVAIVLRAHALTITPKSFIEAARVAGGDSMHIISRHLIPHMLPLAAVNMLLTVTGAIFANGFIAFLGLSRAQLNWGSMIYDAFTYQQINGTIAWNVLLPSALAISLFAASFYFIAQGLHDVAEPRVAEQLLPLTSAMRKKRAVISPPSKLTPRVEKVSGLDKPVLLASPIEASTQLDEASETDFGKWGGVKESIRQPLMTTIKQIDQIGEFSVAILIANLHSDGTVSDFTPSSNLKTVLEDLRIEMKENLERNMGLVEQLNDGSLVACFGLFTHAPLRANVLLAVKSGLELKNLVAFFKRNGEQTDSEGIKLSMGISSGIIRMRTANKKDWAALVLAANPGLIARTLGSFASYMRHGGLLICENTFENLDAVKHHFVFGRQGVARLPVGDDKKMVYELVSGRTVSD
jgi:ABC-type dipeptide/oligopeptide/nickel transport system permease subunit